MYVSSMYVRTYVSIHTTCCMYMHIHVYVVKGQTAYDEIWREKLLRKLMGIKDRMFKWIKSFLAQQFARVNYNNSVSNYHQIR